MHGNPAGSPVAQSHRGPAVLFIPAAIFVALALLAITAYWPGLSGPFLFDDFANLNALGKFGGVRDFDTLKLYLFGGYSGPTGRPISLLSFLIDGQNWPTDPAPFKRTNLVLHLLSGFVLYGLTRQLLLAYGKFTRRDIIIIASLSAGTWLLHPFLASTVLYIVQRMAMLSTFFVFLGLWGYVYGRALVDRNTRSGYIWMSCSLILCTILAVLSKENGILLPLLALVIEYTLLSRVLPVIPDRRWLALFLWIPASVPFLYIARRAINGSLLSSYEIRPFTLMERLLTEPRILFDYLGWWFFPRANSPGLLTQDFPVSQGLLEPPTTILAIMSVAVIITGALLLRKRAPLISLAVLFFFSAHVLESGPIALELYFEHRNYLPAAFLMLPVAAALTMQASKIPILYIAGPVFLMLLAVITWQRAYNWGSLPRLAYHWAEIHPQSQRAQRHAALVARNYDSPARSIEIMESAKKTFPDNFDVHLHLMMLHCRFGVAERSEIDEALVLAEKPFKLNTYPFLKSVVKVAPTDKCRGVSTEDIRQLLDILMSNPTTLGHRAIQRRILHLKGLLELQDKNGELALQYFRNGQSLSPDPDAGLQAAASLATHGYYREALSLIDITEKNLASGKLERFKKRGFLDFEKELKILKQQIETDIQISDPQ